LNEENKLIKKKEKIRKPKRECSKFNGIKKKQSKEIYDQNEIQFNKLKKLKEDKDKIWKDYKKLEKE